MSNTNKVIRGGYWIGISTAFTMIAQFGRVMILTRFLEKSDFGVVSIVNMFIGLCTAFSDLGFASIIMYKQKLTVREFSSLYWIQWVLYILVFAFIAMISPLVSDFYNVEMLMRLIPLSALSVICMSFGKLYDSVLQKKYEFKSIAIRNIITNMTSLILAVLLAMHGFGVLSLIYSTLFQVLLYNVWTFAAGYKFQPLRFQFNFKEVRPLISMGLYQTYTRIADYISSKIDVIIIGKFLGVETLGIYDLSKELVLKFINFVRSVVSQVALPYLSNSNSDDESVKKRFLLVTRIVSHICIPICFTIAVFSKEVLWLVYGKNYIDGQYVVVAFAITSIATSITSFFDMLGIAKGRTDLNFKNTVYRILLTTPVITIASLFSIDILALSQLLITTIMVMVFWKTVVMQTYPINLRLYLSKFDKCLYVTAITSMMFYLMKISVSYILINEYFTMLLSICIYLIILCCAYALFLRKELEELKTILVRK